MSDVRENSELTVADLLAAARRHGLALTSSQDALDTSGLDFLVAHAHDERGVPWIVRRPRRPEVFAASRVEAQVLRLVRPRLPVAVPDWQLHTPEVIAYPRLSGVPVVLVTPDGPVWNLDAAAPGDVFLDSLAAALAALQAVVPDDGVPTRTISEVRAGLAATMDATRATLRPGDAVWVRWQRWIADDESWPRHVALVHGDLHPGHMLIDEGGRLTGILDWTEGCVTDPSVDLAMFLGCFGEAALARLIPRFAAAGGQVWPRIVEHSRERWATFAVTAAEYGLRTGNAAVLAYAREQLATLERGT